MANNRMFIECTGCTEPDLFYLGKRMVDGYYNGADIKADAHCNWFDKHKYCGGTHDHFKLVYQHPENYDLGGVLAILNEKLKP
jgi:hypothetical protein